MVQLVVPAIERLSELPGFPHKIRRPHRTAHLELRTCVKLISRCKLYGTYLTVEAELYGAYLTYHTGKVRQVSGSVACMRWS